MRPVEVQSEWEKVVVEDIDSKVWSEEGDEMIEFGWCGSDCSEPLNVTPLATLKSTETQEVNKLSTLLEGGQSGNHYGMSPWFQNKFQEFCTFVETPVKGVEVFASNFLLAVEEKNK